MRNLKKLFAVIMTVAMLASVMVPALAAEGFQFEDEAQKLYDLGLFKGNSDTSYVPDLGTTLNRQAGLALAIRLLGKDAEVAAMSAEEVATQLAKIVDADEITEWAKPYAAYAVKNGLTNGIDSNILPNVKFGAQLPLTGKEFINFILKIMGYQVAWDDVLTKAAEIGMLSAGDAVTFGTTPVLNRDLAVGIMAFALKGTTVTGVSLAQRLVDEGAVSGEAMAAAGYFAPTATPTAAPVQLGIESVNASNLREVEIVFTGAVDATEGKKAANYKVDGKDAQDAQIMEDGKTVLVTIKNADAPANYSKKTVKILKAVGLAEDTEVKDVLFRDVTVPSVVSVAPTGPRAIEITMSEPMDESIVSVSNFELDNNYVAIASISYNKRVITINTGTDLKEGSHTLNIKNVAGGIADKSGKGVDPASFTFEYVKDTTPIAVSVDSSTETSVKIKFNKAVKDIVGNANVAFRHTYNTDTNQVLGTGAVAMSDGDKVVEITFGAAKPFPPGTTTLYIEYIDNNGTKIADNFGNKLEETTLTITTSADSTKPAVDTVTFKDSNKVEVLFTENVQMDANDGGALKVGNYTLKDAAGDSVTVTEVLQADAGNNKKVNVFTAAKAINGGSYTLTIKGVKDTSIAKNQMEDAVISFTAEDKVPPTLKDKNSTTDGIQIQQVDTKKVKVEFSEVMDSMATDKSLYKPSAGEIDSVAFASGNKAVVLTFKADVNGGITIDIARIKDAAGNWMEAFSTTTHVMALTPIGAKEVAILGKNELKVTIDDVVTGISVTDFVYSVNNGTSYSTPSSIKDVIYDGTKTLITLTVGAAMNENTTNGTNILVATASTVTAKNEFGTKVGFAATAAADKYAPKILTVVAANKDGDATKLGTLTVTFTEALYAPSVQDTDFTLSDGFEVKEITVAGAVVTITVKDKDNTGTATPKVTLSGSVEDTLRNAASAQDAVTSTRAQ